MECTFLIRPHRRCVAKDSGPDVEAQSSENEAENSNTDVGEEGNERRFPMPYYLTPPRTIERPIKHSYTHDTDTEDNAPDLSDDETVAEKSNFDDEQLG